MELHTFVKIVVVAFQNAIKTVTRSKGQPGGIASLDDTGTVPPAQLPISCEISSMELKIKTQN